MLKNLWNRVPATARVPLAVGLVLVLGLYAFAFGARTINWVSRSVFKHGNVVITKQIQKELDDAAASKQLTQELLGQLKAEKETVAKTREAYENDKIKLSAALQTLADKSKTTDQKVRAFNDAMSRAPTVHVAPESTDEQCARAKALGLDLPICN